jgi:hypothetical protein
MQPWLGKPSSASFAKGLRGLTSAEGGQHARLKRLSGQCADLLLEAEGSRLLLFDYVSYMHETMITIHSLGWKLVRDMRRCGPSNY